MGRLAEQIYYKGGKLDPTYGPWQSLSEFQQSEFKDNVYNGLTIGIYSEDENNKPIIVDYYYFNGTWKEKTITSIKGKTINLSADNVKIMSDNFNVDQYGNVRCRNLQVDGKITCGVTQITPDNLQDYCFDIIDNYYRDKQIIFYDTNVSSYPIFLLDLSKLNNSIYIDYTKDWSKIKWNKSVTYPNLFIENGYINIEQSSIWQRRFDDNLKIPKLILSPLTPYIIDYYKEFDQNKYLDYIKSITSCLNQNFYFQLSDNVYDTELNPSPFKLYYYPNPGVAANPNFKLTCFQNSFENAIVYSFNLTSFEINDASWCSKYSGYEMTIGTITPMTLKFLELL